MKALFGLTENYKSSYLVTWLGASVPGTPRTPRTVILGHSRHIHKPASSEETAYETTGSKDKLDPMLTPSICNPPCGLPSALDRMMLLHLLPANARKTQSGYIELVHRARPLPKFKLPTTTSSKTRPGCLHFFRNTGQYMPRNARMATVIAASVLWRVHKHRGPGPQG